MAFGIGLVALGAMLFARLIGERANYRLIKYRYEVVNEDSPYHGNVDFIYSDISLRARHEGGRPAAPSSRPC